MAKGKRRWRERARDRARVPRVGCIDWAWHYERARAVAVARNEDVLAKRSLREQMLGLAALIFGHRDYERISGETTRKAWRLTFPHPCDPLPSPPQCSAVGLYAVQAVPWYRSS